MQKTTSHQTNLSLANLCFDSSITTRLEIGEAELKQRWAQYLETKVASQELSTETATNYRRLVSRYLEHLLQQGTLEEVFSNNFYQLTAIFLNKIAQDTPGILRNTQGAILGHFIHMAIETGGLIADERRLELLRPLPYYQYTSPMIESWLKEQFPDGYPDDEKQVVDRRNLMRNFLMYIVTAKISITHEQIKNDARPLLEQEVNGEARVALVTNTWKQGSTPLAPHPPYYSGIEYMLWDRNIVEGYLNKIGLRRDTRRTLEVPLSQLGDFYDWARAKNITTLIPEDLFNPFDPAQKQAALERSPQIFGEALLFNTPKDGLKPEPEIAVPEKIQVEAPTTEVKIPVQKVKSAKTQKVTSKPKLQTEQKTAPRRETHDTTLLNGLEIRDALITKVVTDRVCGFGALSQVTNGDLSLRKQYIKIQFAHDQSRTIEDPDLIELFEHYLNIRSQSSYPDLGDGKSNFLVSADGGSLVVDTTSDDLIVFQDFQKLRLAQAFLITYLIQNEEISFSEIRIMTEEDLCTRDHLSKKTPGHISDYLQILKDSYLDPEQESAPAYFKFAFPGADGKSLTADGFSN